MQPQLWFSPKSLVLHIFTIVVVNKYKIDFSEKRDNNRRKGARSRNTSYFRDKLRNLWIVIEVK